jgi:hypothetical protein
MRVIDLEYFFNIVYFRACVAEIIVGLTFGGDVVVLFAPVFLCIRTSVILRFIISFIFGNTILIGATLVFRSLLTDNFTLGCQVIAFCVDFAKPFVLIGFRSRA